MATVLENDAVEKLTGLVDKPDRYDIPFEALAETQVAAMNQRFQARKAAIKLLGHRAEEAGLSEIRSREEAVQVLFPHTAYKSYPESFLIGERWDRMSKWLDTVSAYRVPVDRVKDAADVDGWLANLEAEGIMVACSSGTTGKSAMLPASRADMEWLKREAPQAYAWGSGTELGRDRQMFGMAPIAYTPRNLATGEAYTATLQDPNSERFAYPVPPITVGDLTKMVVLRKKIAEGTATPSELEEMEKTSAVRQKAVDDAIGLTAEALIKDRARKIHVTGLWKGLYDVAVAVRALGYSGKDFNPENSIYVGGGLKRAKLPDDYREFVYETFNIQPSRNYQNYSMQELHSGMPRCQKGQRYHIPPWVVPLVLDQPGETLLPIAKGEYEGRAAFFDLSIDGRWGGVISGDKIAIDFSPCPCGHKGPSIRDDIARYADLEGDDKIGCAGTVDAYVRGVMNQITDIAAAEPIVSAPFFLRGKLVEGMDTTHKSRDLGVTFATPRIDLDAAVHPRTEVPPLLNVPLAEIIDFLVETGERIRDPRNAIFQDCIDRMCAQHILPREVVAHQALHATAILDKRRLWAELEQNFPDPKALDGWVPKQDYTGRKSFVRAFAPRLVHVLPGNSPGVAVKSIAHGALVKAVNLFKMSSSDPFTTVAILRTMAEIDPEHPIVKSMSAVYWRGGDAQTESILLRPQYFDKIVGWGGGDAINNLIKYTGPGLQLVSFDPKTSISMVGREAHATPELQDQVAALAAGDVMTLNQEACVASRFQFVEGSEAEVDAFCARLHHHIATRAAASGDVRPCDMELKEAIEVLSFLDDEYRVWGKPDGRGVVIRSEEPVDFHPINKTANVVRVDRLDDAVKWINVATQTVGFHPFDRMADYRDRLASGGAQRIVHLGEAGPSTIGNPHDAMYPLHRFVHWMAHEDGVAED